MIQNIKYIQELLKKYGIKMWFMVNKDNNDFVFTKYISSTLYTQSFIFILENKAILIVSELDVHSIDVEKLKKHNIFVKVYKNEDEMNDLIEDSICFLQYVDKIALSYSTLGDKDTDIMLSYDIKRYKTQIRNIYFKYHKRVTFCSSEKIVYELISANSKEYLEKIRLVSKMTEEILENTFNSICYNMTEIEIANLVTNSMQLVSRKYIGKLVVCVECAWELGAYVFTGVNGMLNGHSRPTDKPLKKGDTIFIDYGIKAVFSDGTSCFSDMQRMGYVLKENEKEPPDKVLKVFNTLTEAIDNALDYMKPGVKGFVVDDIVRNHIIKEGYPNYMHASGHPVGSRVHGIGTIISGKLQPRSKIALVDTGVYTLEPRIQIENGGSIEEMILVTKFGGMPVYKFQKELYIIK